MPRWKVIGARAISSLLFFLFIRLYSTTFSISSYQEWKEEDILTGNQILANGKASNRKLLNLTNFQYILNPACTLLNPSIQTIVLVTSHVNNVGLRDAQRDAFNRHTLEKTFRIKRFFLLAYDSQNEQSLVEQESIKNGDIVQGNFEEAYTMLSYKHVMGLQWVTQQCKFDPDSMPMILKMDDDIVVDYHQLLQKLETFAQPDLQQNLFGLQHLEMGIQRHGKWALGQNDIRDVASQNTYPNFLSGWAYVCSFQSAQLLVQAANNENEIFWIDDVWLTGILSKKVGLKLVSLNPYYTVFAEHIMCCVQDPSFTCEFIVGPSDGNETLIRDFGSHVLNCLAPKSDHCKKRTLVNSVVHTCSVKNPLFLPQSGGIGEVIP